MTWFVVSIISVIETFGELENEFPVSEEFYLFFADSKQELQQKIDKKKAVIDAAGASGLTYKGLAATERCLGTRKVRSICNEPPLDMDLDPPTDGTHLTHSFMIVKSLSDAELLAQGKSVLVDYIDNGNDDDSEE